MAIVLRLSDGDIDTFFGTVADDVVASVLSKSITSLDVDDPVDRIDPPNDFPLLTVAMGTSEPLQVNSKYKIHIKNHLKIRYLELKMVNRFPYRRVEYSFSNFSRVVLPNNGLLMFNKDAGLSFAL
jgi:hypothetical protein